MSVTSAAYEAWYSQNTSGALHLSFVFRERLLIGCSYHSFSTTNFSVFSQGTRKSHAAQPIQHGNNAQLTVYVHVSRNGIMFFLKRRLKVLVTCSWPFLLCTNNNNNKTNLHVFFCLLNNLLLPHLPDHSVFLCLSC